MISWIERLLSYIFPRRCLFCNTLLTPGQLCCAACVKQLEQLFIKQHCPRCGGDPTGCNCAGREFVFARNLSVYAYTGLVRTGIHRFKFSHRPDGAKVFAVPMAALIRREYPVGQLQLITAVPSNPETLRERGYNQAQLLAKEIARILQLPCDFSLLRRIDTPKQHTLHLKQRLENAKAGYTTGSSRRAQGKQILLIDDIFTTGATMQVCSQLLLDQGAQQVWCATASHAHLQQQ